jgi:hypothetical protein
MHAGAYVGAIQATFAGDDTHLASSSGPYGSYLVIAQLGSLAYTGDVYVVDTAALNVSVAVDQRTLASDPQLLDFSANPIWVRFDVSGPAGSATAEARVTDDAAWATTGRGRASVFVGALPDGAYTVRSQVESNPYFVAEDARAGAVSSPTRGGFTSGGGAIASDPAANTADTRGYFSLQLAPGQPIRGSMSYGYRANIDVGGGVRRDVDVVVISTDVTLLNGGKSTPTAAGHVTVGFTDALTGQAYSSLGFTGGAFQLTAIDGGANQPDLFGLALYRPDGSLFHATGPLDRKGDAQPATVVIGSIVSTL